MQLEMMLAMGVFAAVLTTSCWVPQLRRTVRRGTASDFAWPYLALLSVGLAGWFVYGILRDDMVIVVSNALVLGSVLVVISVKLRSRGLTFDYVELARAGWDRPSNGSRVPRRYRSVAGR
jgi:MtN3 and saliva related transmembrane protein